MKSFVYLPLLPLPLLLPLVRQTAVYGDDPEVTSNPGDDVTLPCRSDGHNIVAVNWTRTDLKSQHVFLYRDGHLVLRNQHPSFEGRVQLVDRDLKDRDASLILKNVSSSDEGTYECQVTVDDSTRKKRSIIKTEPIRRVRLQVTGSDDGDMKGGAMKGGANTGVYIGLAVAGFLVCLSVVGFVVCFVVWKRRRRLNNDPEAPPADEAERVELCDM